MSLPTFRQAYAFFVPLTRRDVVFTVSRREGNEIAARFLLACLSTLKKHVTILDTSAFYGINAVALTSGLSVDFLRNSGLYSPTGDFLDLLATLVKPNGDVIIIDDMNALYHTVFREREKPGIHKLFSLMRLLGYSARNNNFTILSTVYGNEGGRASERRGVRSLSAMGDLQIAVEHGPGEITFKCEAGKVWPSNRFTVMV